MSNVGRVLIRVNARQHHYLRKGFPPSGVIAFSALKRCRNLHQRKLTVVIVNDALARSLKVFKLTR
jgi:hypothetical protein